MAGDDASLRRLMGRCLNKSPLYKVSVILTIAVVLIAVSYYYHIARGISGSENKKTNSENCSVKPSPVLLAKDLIKAGITPGGDLAFPESFRMEKETISSTDQVMSFGNGRAVLQGGSLRGIIVEAVPDPDRLQRGLSVLNITTWMGQDLFNLTYEDVIQTYGAPNKVLGADPESWYTDDKKANSETNPMSAIYSYTERGSSLISVELHFNGEPGSPMKVARIAFTYWLPDEDLGKYLNEVNEWP
jgi:hypothetical protein